jgi:hypothetical protein
VRRARGLSGSVALRSSGPAVRQRGGDAAEQGGCGTGGGYGLGLGFRWVGGATGPLKDRGSRPRRAGPKERLAGVFGSR